MFKRSDVFYNVNCSCCYNLRCIRCWDGPTERTCTNGDFGNDYICENITAELEQRIEEGLDTHEGYLLRADMCEGIEKNVRWEDHKYWWIWHDEREPEPYSSLDEIWEKLFV